MAQNEDFKELMIRSVELQYPRLNGCYRFNSVEKKSEACAPTVTNAAWSVSFKYPEAEAKALYKEMKAHYEACRKRNPKLPEFSTVFGMKKLEEGGVSFAAKRKGTTAAGKVNTPPTVIDHKKQPLANLDIWSGSVGTLKISAFPATDPEGKGGISFALSAVQVIKPVYGGSSLDDFDVVDAPDEPGEFTGDPFAATAKKPAAAAMDDDGF
jgi:hypothetical protein